MSTYGEEFNYEKHQIVEDNYETKLNINGIYLNIALWDKQPREEYDALRALSYVNANLFILLYAVNNRESFINVHQKWYAQSVPYPKAGNILVANKIDLRKSQNDTISTNEGKLLAEKMNANSFLEVSTLDINDCKQVIEEIAKVLLELKTVKKTGGCYLL